MPSRPHALLSFCLFFLPAAILAEPPAVDTLLRQAHASHTEGLDYDYSNQPAKAIEAYDRALQLRKQALNQYGVTADSVLEGIIKGYFNIGDSWQYLGDYGRMQTYYDSCEQVQQRFEQAYQYHSDYRRAKLYHGYGQLYRRVAGLERAMLALQQALYYYAADDSQEWYYREFDQGQVLNDISAVYVEWKTAPDSAIHYANRALTRYAKVESAPAMQWPFFTEAKASALINLGYGYQRKGALSKAEGYFRQALQLLEGIRTELKEELGAGVSAADQPYFVSEFGYLGGALNNAANGLSITLSAAGRHPEAERLLRQSIERDAWLKDLQPGYVQASILLGSDYYNLAKAYYQQQRYRKALDYNERAVQELQPSHSSAPDQSAFYVYNDLYWIEAQTGKARCLKQLNETEAALETTALTLQHISRIRKNYQDARSRNQLAAMVKNLTEVGVWAALQQSDAGLAFEYTERSKIFTLLEAIRDHRTRGIAGMDEEELQQEQALRRSIARTQERMWEAQQEADLQPLRVELAQQQEALAALLGRLEQQEEYRRLYFEQGPVSATTAAGLLHDGQAMISYFVGEENTVAFLLRPGKTVQAVSLGISEQQLSREVSSLLEALRYSYQDKKLYTEGYPAGRNRAQLEAQFLESARWVYDHCLQPLAASLEGNRLVLLPDGPLHQLPFSLLVSGERKAVAGAYHTYPFLSERYALSYCYAATLLAEMQQPSRERTEAVLAFAPSFGGPVTAERGGLGHLRFNQLEVRELCGKRACMPGPFLGARALKQAFLDNIEQRPYALLHLSTHSQANYTDPGSSFIAFRQESSVHIDPEQLLYLRELYGLQMQVETVVLSSCETNIGPVQRGAGMLSITRGFAFAGAKSIVSSLWAVNEESTKILMSLFYDAIHSGLSRDEALRQAKEKLQANGAYQHPYYWAAFLPVGKVEEARGSGPIYLWAGLGGLGLLLLLLYRRRSVHR